MNDIFSSDHSMQDMEQPALQAKRRMSKLTFCRHYWKLAAFRVVSVLPSLIFCLFAFSSTVYYLGDGPSWIEYENLFSECETYWWTPVLFMNDVIPFFAKDEVGCMRWTAFLSIEVKLFLALPVLVYMFHVGNEFMAAAIALSLAVFGLVVYGSVLYFYRIHPGYLMLFDYQSFDLVSLKPWNHIDAYFSGLLLSFLF